MIIGVGSKFIWTDEVRIGVPRASEDIPSFPVHAFPRWRVYWTNIEDLDDKHYEGGLQCEGETNWAQVPVFQRLYRSFTTPHSHAKWKVPELHGRSPTVPAPPQRSLK